MPVKKKLYVKSNKTKANVNVFSENITPVRLLKTFSDLYAKTVRLLETLEYPQNLNNPIQPNERLKPLEPIETIDPKKLIFEVKMTSGSTEIAGLIEHWK